MFQARLEDLDGNTAALRAEERRIDRAEQAEARYEQACADRALDLMTTDNFRTDRLAAVDEMLSERGEDTDRQLSAALQRGPTAFGAALMAATYAYFFKEALKQAHRELNLGDFQ